MYYATHVMFFCIFILLTNRFKSCYLTMTKDPKRIQIVQINWLKTVNMQAMKSLIDSCQILGWRSCGL